MGLEWYGVKTFPGYEHKVQEKLNKLIEKEGLESQITDTFIPTYKNYTFVRKEIRLKEELIFPGYVFIKMNLTNELMYTVRGVQYIIGYAGTNEQKQKPDILTEEEVQKMVLDSQKLSTSIEEGTNVLYIDGFNEEEVTIKSIDLNNKTITTTNDKIINFDNVKKIK